MAEESKTKNSIVAVAVALCLLAGGAAVIAYLTMSADEVIVPEPAPNASVAPAPAIAPPPPPTGTPAPEAVAIEVRQAVIQVLSAIMEGDNAKLSAGTLVEKPEYQPLADAGEALTRDGIRFRQAVVAKFGSVPEELAGMMPGGPKAFREQFLPTAPVLIDGDTATVPLPPGSVPPNMLLRKTDGQWKLLTGGSFLSGEQKDPQKIAASLMGIASAYQQTAADLEAGRCQSIPEAISRLQARMQQGMAQ